LRVIEDVVMVFLEGHQITKGIDAPQVAGMKA
jgi:hypothetical protein